MKAIKLETENNWIGGFNESMLISLPMKEPSWAGLWAAGTMVTLEWIVTITVKHTVVRGPLHGVPLAVHVVAAGPDAVLEAGHPVRFHKVAPTLHWTVAVPGWTPVFGMNLCITINALKFLLYLTFSGRWCKWDIEWCLALPRDCLCSWQRRHRGSVRAPMTTNCSHRSFCRICGRHQQLEYLGSWRNTPVREFCA